MRAEVDLQTRKTSITVPGSRSRYPKPTKTPFQTPTKQPGQIATSTHPAETSSNKHHQPPTATPETASPNAIIETINAHNLEEDCQGNRKLKAPNGHTEIPKEVHITKSSIKLPSNGANVDLKQDSCDIECKLALQPTSQA